MKEQTTIRLPAELKSALEREAQGRGYTYSMGITPYNKRSVSFDEIKESE
jgi:hypothetical protein